MRYFCTHCDASHMTEEQSRYHATIVHGFPYRPGPSQAKHFPVVVTALLLALSSSFVIAIALAVAVKIA